jgi:hypothetical protein
VCGNTKCSDVIFTSGILRRKLNKRVLSDLKKKKVEQSDTHYIAFAFVLSVCLSLSLSLSLSLRVRGSDEVGEMARRGADGLKVNKQQPPEPPLTMAKGTGPLKQIAGFTLLANREVACESET